MTSVPVDNENINYCATRANNIHMDHIFPYLRSVHMKSGLVPSLLQNHVIGGREGLVGSRFTHLYCSSASTLELGQS